LRQFKISSRRTRINHLQIQNIEVDENSDDKTSPFLTVTTDDVETPKSSHSVTHAVTVEETVAAVITAKNALTTKPSMPNSKRLPFFRAVRHDARRRTLGHSYEIYSGKNDSEFVERVPDRPVSKGQFFVSKKRDEFSFL
jgi:hypothetical protein